MPDRDTAPAPYDRRLFLRTALVTGGVVLTGGALASCRGQEEANASAPSSAPDGTDLGKASGVPVSGAKIYADARVVVSQPAAGDFKAFSAVCTHQGCIIGEISGDVMVCPCHNSRFSVDDGSVVHGPATRALPTRAVHVEGDELVLGPDGARP